jgi:hypothetical protein
MLSALLLVRLQPKTSGAGNRPNLCMGGGVGYNPKLFIGVCNSQEYVPSDFHWSWEMTEKPYEYDIVRFTHSDDSVRNNQMINLFLKGDCDIMVKMDVDQKYPRHYFSFLVPHVEKLKVVGPLIFNKWRNVNYPPLMFERNEYPRLGTPMDNYSGIIEVPYPHTNLLYAKEVLENIEPPWYEKHYDQMGLGRINDMDFTFLDKIKEQGYKLYINTGVEVEHLVHAGVDSKLHNRWNRK